MKSMTPGATTALPTFVYGTLMNPQVVSTLLGRSWSPQEEAAILPARLYGHARHRVQGHVFPATIPTKNQDDFVEGLLLPPTLSSLEMSLLDYFEGDEYRRMASPVHVLVENDEPKAVETSTSDIAMPNTSTTVDAQVYLWKDDLISQLEIGKEWSYEDFCSLHLEWYLTHTVGPCREEMVRLGMTASD
jgi:hypothetical protein